MKLINISEDSLQTESVEEEIALGIDLGTTNSLVAISENQVPRVLFEEGGDEAIKSLISLSKNNEIIVGGKGDKIVLRSVKRLMGKVSDDLTDDLKKYNYNIIAEDGQKIISLDIGKRITPIEASSEILKALKKRAEKILKKEVSKAVITVPAYFDDAARQATKDAAKLANIEVLRLINEPTSACLMYGLDNQKEGFYAVFDFGGGTFDVSIIKMQKGVLKVVATGGDNFLGGDDIDIILADYFAKNNVMQKNFLLNLAKKAKKILAENKDFFDKNGKITLLEFQKLIDPILNKALELFANVIKDAKIKFSDLNETILVGGSTKISYLKEKLAELIGKKPLDNINPDNIVVLGSAVQAENLTTGTGNLLIDIIPLSLGLETMGGIVEKIIPRNSTIPINESQTFTTFKDNQNGMKIHIVQGERELAEQNRSLAFFELTNIPALPAGAAKVKIDFNIDSNGILTVSSHEEITGQKQEIQVKPSYGLEISDMQKMLQDSLENAQDDMKIRLVKKNMIAIEQIVGDIYKIIDDEDYSLSKKQKLDAKNIAKGFFEQKDDLAKQKKYLELDKLMKKAKKYLDDLCIAKVDIITNSLKGKSIDDQQF